MKKAIFTIFAICFTLFMPLSVCVALYEGYSQKAAVTFGNLKIVSFSEQYDENYIKEIYNELINNFHSKEFDYLNAIYLYPDSPEGVAGNYYEDINIDENGRYSIGNKSYIELFNMDKRSPQDIAPVLAHEYGHHYTICNMTLYENKYYSSWKDGEYGKIRSLYDYPVVYDASQEDYSHAWDITEIAANDYVQLLGSENAKTSWEYKDSEQMVLGGEQYIYAPTYYNMRPQENYDIPLAADVGGLFQYLLTIGGYTGEAPHIAKKAEITSILSEDSFLNKKYTIFWDKAISGGNGGFEYTVIMYPADFPFLSTGIKTVGDGDDMRAVFGTVTNQNDDGTMSAIMDYYIGKYVFCVYAKDEEGYIFSSEKFYYDFGNDYFDITEHYNDAGDIPEEIVEYEEPSYIDETVSEPWDSQNTEFLHETPAEQIPAVTAGTEEKLNIFAHTRNYSVNYTNKNIFVINNETNDIYIFDKIFIWKAVDYKYDKKWFRGNEVCYLRQNIPIVYGKVILQYKNILPKRLS